MLMESDRLLWGMVACCFGQLGSPSTKKFYAIPNSSSFWLRLQNLHTWSLGTTGPRPGARGQGPRNPQQGFRAAGLECRALR